ncbi:dolichol-phosphate mannose synthase subunit 3-like [Rhododendron vialii]|uniref:dolichol-phosphate mannose synthase subunit 3-like n=1 Tax=Rhododendron vialii TaxID=182163 RepID=UPI00265E0D56|nr:dolichol-phosphate mannose synthase subunit 3-like [Rhododendron vialii]
MKRVAKIMTLLVAISAFWIGLLLQTSMVPRSYTWLLPLYFVLSLGCYGLLMVGVGLMQFRTCPQEAVLLQQDIVEAKGFLEQRGVHISSY